MKSSFLKWIAVSAALSLLAPACWFLVLALFGGPNQWKILQVIMVVWPSSIFLMATDGIEGTPRSYFFVFMSVAANAVLYILVGTAVWWLKRLWGAPKRQV